MGINKIIQFNIFKMTESLKWIYQNQPESIFYEPTFAMLKMWYEKYGLKSSIAENIETMEFELGEVYLKEIQKEASWLRFITDTSEIEEFADKIVFDKCIDQTFVNQALKSTQKKIYESKGKKRVFILCNGQDILKINTFLEMYFDNLSQIKKPLYVNVSVIIEDKMYFTVCNDENLYVLNLKTQEISLFMCLKSKIHNRNKFVGMFVYNHRLWLIPCYENEIFVCDLRNKTLYKLPIPTLEKQDNDEAKFRRSVQIDDRYLWLLPQKDKALICIDMEKLTYEIYNNWPEQVSFDEKATMNFKSMCYFGGKLFLSRTGCSHNIIFDINSGKMMIWDVAYADVFATVYKDHFYLNPCNEENVLRIMEFDSETYEIGNCIESYDISSEIKSSNVYSYWHTERLDNNVYFLPLDAKSIIIYSLEEKKFNKIEPVIEDYNNLRETNVFGGFCVQKSDGYAYIMPYMGNKLIWMDSMNSMYEFELIYPIMDIKNILDMQIEKAGLLDYYQKYFTKIVFLKWNGAFNDTCDMSCGKRIYENVK